MPDRREKEREEREVGGGGGEVIERERERVREREGEREGRRERVDKGRMIATIITSSDLLGVATIKGRARVVY